MAITAAQAAAAINSTPVTKEWASSLLASQSQILPADGLVAANAAITNAVTNQALVTVPASVTALAVAGSVFRLHAWGLYTMPASAMPTLCWHTYSGGSGGTVLDGMIAVAAPLASAAANLWNVESTVSFYSGVLVQVIQKAEMQTSISTTSAGNVWLAGNASATAVTVTASNTLTLNAVMGSAVSASSFQCVGGYYEQIN
jgi:hypothetical protein